MKTYRITFNMERFARSTTECKRAGFGRFNEGLIGQGESPLDAVERMNAARLPGERLHPFYLRATEVRS